MKRSAIPQLIVVDGLPGSGKTTTCRWLEQQLHQRHLKPYVVYEAAVPHPLHWWHYWDGAHHQGPDFDRLSPSRYMQTSIEKWTRFIDHVRQSEEIVIVEGVLYCLSASLFLQGDAAGQAISAYIHHVEAIIMPVTPLLIYLRQDPITEHTRKVWSSRGAMVEQFLIENMERTRYFRRRQLHGFDGVIALWQDTQALTDDLFAKHQIPKVAIEVTQGKWEAYHQQILKAVLRKT